MSFETYMIFFLTTLVVVFTPGAAAICVASQGASNGGRRAISGVSGIALANVIYFALSATGIASLILASHQLFAIIKWVGVAYLIWLGLNIIISPSAGFDFQADRKKSSLASLFTQGFVIEFANPKALLYFTAILPQFLNIDAPIIPQILIMGLTTLFLDFSAYSAYAFLGDRLTRVRGKLWLKNLIKNMAGGALIYAGFRMASVGVSR